MSSEANELNGLSIPQGVEAATFKLAARLAGLRCKPRAVHLRLLQARRSRPVAALQAAPRQIHLPRHAGLTVPPERRGMAAQPAPSKNCKPAPLGQLRWTRPVPAWLSRPSARLWDRTKQAVTATLSPAPHLVLGTQHRHISTRRSQQISIISETKLH